MSIRSHLAALTMIGALAVVPQLASAQTKFANSGPAASAMGTQQVIDINTASKPELMTLDGIGDNRSEAIIHNRPFRSKDELVNRNVVPASVYSKIQSQITVRQ